MAIQWFPGHMNAARKQVMEAMIKVDIVVEIVDARAPVSSTNPMLEKLRLYRQRPVLKILNKADLADPALNRIWLDWFRAQVATEAILLGEGNKVADVQRIPQLCRQIVPHRIGGVKPVRALILGIPNVGKSTLMNILLNRKVAKVADTPGVTQHVQRVELPDGMIVYDTPGLLWPKIEYEDFGYRLAMVGSVGRNAYSEDDVAWFAIETFSQRYPELLKQRYKLDHLDIELEALFQQIGRKRGAVLSGSRVDYQKTADLILTDFRSGILGRITLETPADLENLVPLGDDRDPIATNEDVD